MVKMLRILETILLYRLARLVTVKIRAPLVSDFDVASKICMLCSSFLGDIGKSVSMYDLFCILVLGFEMMLKGINLDR